MEAMQSMLTLKSVKANTALLVALATPVGTIAPLLIAGELAQAATPVRVAQQTPVLFNQLRIASGAVLPVSYEKAEKIVVAPTETMPLVLTIPQTVKSSRGVVLIPSGSTVEGEIRPAGNGSQFVARTLVLTNGTRYSLDASSAVITRRETIRKGTSTKAIGTGAAIGAGAAAILAATTGNKKVGVGEVILGGAIGGLGGLVFGKKQAEVIVINPNVDLDLRLSSALALNY
jgi:hypothetical protein